MLPNGVREQRAGFLRNDEGQSQPGCLRSGLIFCKNVIAKLRVDLIRCFLFTPLQRRPKQWGAFKGQGVSNAP